MYKLVVLQDNAAKRGLSVDPYAMLWQAFVPDFPSSKLHDLSQSYTTVFAPAAVSAGSTLIPVVFLPKKPACHVSTFAYWSGARLNEC
ncbi:hypothetical protein [Mycobacterium uberis]|uniref:hypothetical protein n=1 Tax=Mycobacterium uberis TaxID=2162698 RepID=UPI000E303BAA|nr:hypothetical protein [Mycobacterium uberis]